MSHLEHRRSYWFLAPVILLASYSEAFADELPLREKIDQLIADHAVGPIAIVADDSTFLRRVYLDLIGRIPSLEETQKFLGDESSEKRRKLVDDLLSRQEFSRHMAVTFDVMLMERRGGKHVSSTDFRTYLEKSFTENKSYLTLVEEILAADGTPEKNRPASAFYLERDVEPNLLTRELGRVFFGVDLQCAQCHDHPNIDDYYQQDYYGLQAFVVRSSLFQPDKKKPALIAEKAEGEAAFKSVFTDREGLTGPRLIGGDEIVETVLKPGEQYKVAPAKNVRHIPNESRLEKLANLTTGQPTESFNRNIANRLWRHMFGRGLVEPVDLHHSGNPPSHPELLSALAKDFAARNYDVKSFLHEIALSETYQRSSRFPSSFNPGENLQARIQTLNEKAEAKQQESYDADSEVDHAIEILDAAVAEVKPLREAISAANKLVAEALKARDTAAGKVKSRQKEIAGKVAQQKVVQEAAEKAKLASETLKDDKELIAAAETIRKKSETLNALIVKLRESEKKEVAALGNAEKQLKEQQVAADTAIVAAVPGEEKVRQLRDKLIELRTLAASHRTAAELARREVDHLQGILDHQTAHQEIVKLTKQIPELEQSLAQTSNSIQNLTEMIGKSRQKLQAGVAQTEQLQSQVAATQSQLAAGEETATELASSLSEISLAGQRAEMPTELMSAQTQLAASLSTIEGDNSAMQAQLTRWESQLTKIDQTVNDYRSKLKKSETEFKVLQNQAVQLDRQLQQARQDLQKQQEFVSTNQDTLIDHATRKFTVAGLIPLTPEQLGWSILTATGQSERQRRAEAAKLNKEKPLSEEEQKKPDQVAEREKAIDAATFASLNKNVDRFVKLFGGGAGQPQHEFFATADQALFFSNGGEIRSWLSPSNGNLTDRLNKKEDPAELSRDLYLSIFCRQPTDAETQEVIDYLADRSDEKVQAVQELTWALLTSAEFRFRY